LYSPSKIAQAKQTLSRHGALHPEGSTKEKAMGPAVYLHDAQWPLQHQKEDQDNPH
jgi:hypothetical protein